MQVTKTGKDHKKRRLLALCMAAAVIAMLLFSAHMISMEAHHDCSGEDCPICICIHQVESNLNQLGGAALQIVLPVIVLLCVAAALLLCEGFFSNSLVSEKIRMNN